MTDHSKAAKGRQEVSSTGTPIQRDLGASIVDDHASDLRKLAQHSKAAYGHRFNNGLRYRDGEHPDQTQFTPEYVLRNVRQDLGVDAIGLDPCTTTDNPVGAERFYTADDDGLAQPWNADTIFCNPPYGKAREPWVRRCIEAGRRESKVILLIPAATDTRIFHRAAESATAIVFVQARLTFGTLRENRRQHAASHPSALIGWNTSLEWCRMLGWKAVAA